MSTESGMVGERAVERIDAKSGSEKGEASSLPQIATLG